MNVGSLFSGIGGIDLGLERAGMQVAWFCEQDAYCQRVLGARWPGIPIHPDVRTIEAEPVVDLICGGFPCQPFSAAGKRLGVEDERWLWPPFARVVGELRPRYVLVENVPGLLAGHRGMGHVLGDLAALGYDAEWDCIPASAVGAPHQRDRVWIVAYPASSSRSSEPSIFATGRPLVGTIAGSGRRDQHGDSPEGVRRLGSGVGGSSGRGSEVADADREGQLQQGGSVGEERGRSGNGGESLADSEGEPIGAGLRSSESAEERWRRSGDGSSQGGVVQDADSGSVESWGLGRRTAQASSAWWWAAEPDVGRVAHGVPSRLDRLAALGNAVVPQVAEWIGLRILEREAALNGL